MAMITLHVYILCGISSIIYVPNLANSIFAQQSGHQQSSNKPGLEYSLWQTNHRLWLHGNRLAVVTFHGQSPDQSPLPRGAMAHH